MGDQDSGHAAGPPFRLQTFGAVVLTGTADGQGAAYQRPQRRRLALLAVLAAAGDRGRTRDQLLGYFWSDGPQERGRHALEQTLYAVRGALRHDVFTGVDPLRIDPGVLGSDVADFEHALAEANDAAAVALYRGPFLDGFYLADTPEFERWVEADRARLHRLYAQALERLARAADADGNREGAVRWWRKLSDAEPLSGRHAIGLVRALANAGDHTAALQHAQGHETLVRRELDSSVDPDVAAIVAELRAHAGKRAPVFPDEPTSRNPRTTGTPEAPTGAEATASAPILPQPARSTGRLAWYGLAMALVAAAAMLVPGLRRRHEGTPASEPSVVVLPLSNRGTDPDDGALADGVTEELISAIAKLGHLRVIASTSAFAFKGRSLDVRRVGDSLRVTHVVEGDLQRSGSRIRLQVRLIDVRDGATRWAETYDRDMKDLLATEDDLAAAVARELAVRLQAPRGTSGLRHHTQSVAAYAWYVRGQDPVLFRSDSGARRGVEYFNRAITADSTFAAAWAGLAGMYVVLHHGADTTLPPLELSARAEAAARRAIALDDSLAEAHMALGLVLTERNLTSARAELERALALEPSLTRALEYLAYTEMLTGRFGDALAHARQGVALDPLSPTANAELARALWLRGECDEALAHLRALEGVTPPVRRAGLIRGLCLADQHRWAEAIAVLRRSASAGGARAKAVLAAVLAEAGQAGEARRILGELLATERRHRNMAFEVATAFAGLGDVDESLSWLGKAAADGSWGTEVMGPMFRQVRRDPRFEPIYRRLAP